MHFRRWEAAWAEALYGVDGFYRQPAGPASHFRTSIHADPEAIAETILTIAEHYGISHIVDVGAGRGELANVLAMRAEELGAPRIWAVDVVTRPEALHPNVVWVQTDGGSATPNLAELGLAEIPILVIAHELLDVIPCLVAEVAESEDGWAEVWVNELGQEELRPLTNPDHSAWLEAWWPYRDGCIRAESGVQRDTWWHDVLNQMTGVAIAVDYAHQRDSRPIEGSLSSFRNGREVPARPDSTCDITAHVAMDAVAAAGIRAGAQTVTHLNQADLLDALHIPSRTELRDPGSLGSFIWLIQQRGLDATPAIFSQLPTRE